MVSELCFRKRAANWFLPQYLQVQIFSNSDTNGLTGFLSTPSFQACCSFIRTSRTMQKNSWFKGKEEVCTSLTSGSPKLICWQEFLVLDKHSRSASTFSTKQLTRSSTPPSKAAILALRTRSLQSNSPPAKTATQRLSSIGRANTSPWTRQLLRQRSWKPSATMDTGHWRNMSKSTRRTLLIKFKLGYL